VELPLASPWFVDRAWFQPRATACRRRCARSTASIRCWPGARPELRASLATDMPPFLLDALLAASKEVWPKAKSCDCPAMRGDARGRGARAAGHRACL